MLQQAAHVAERIGRRAGRLQDEPLVHHQAILMPLVVVLLHQRIAARQFGGNACAQRGQRVGHVIRFVILLAHQSVRQLGFAKRQIAQAGIAQRTFTNVRVLNAISVKLVGVINGEELIGQFCSQRTGQRFTHRHDGNRVDDVKQLGDFSR